jgi:hypothetical protein
MGWDSGGFMGSAGESSQGMDANAVGMGALGGAGSPTGANYGWITRAIIDAYSRRFGGLGYGGNSSLLGIDKSVFGGPMIPDGPVDIQGGVPTDANPGGYETVDFTPATSLASVDLTGGPPRNDYGFLANNANILGLGPNYSGIGMDFGGHPNSGLEGDIDGGGERPWWLEGTNNGMGMMNPATGGWNDWDAPYTGTWPPNNLPPQLVVNPGMPGFPQGPQKRPNPIDINMPYTRPKRPNLAYGNAYDNAFIGGDDM